MGGHSRYVTFLVEIIALVEGDVELLGQISRDG
jgi:hypothetical protein